MSAMILELLSGWDAIAGCKLIVDFKLERVDQPSAMHDDVWIHRCPSIILEGMGSPIKIDDIRMPITFSELLTFTINC